MTDRGTRLEHSEFFNGGEINEHARSFAIMTKVDVDREWAKFCDYWLAKTGAGATKKDWLATWRNWCRKAEQDGERRPWRDNGSNSESDRLVASSRHIRNTPISIAIRALEELKRWGAISDNERRALNEWKDTEQIQRRAKLLGVSLNG